ncbi:hypothetical protein SDC9_100798 [bioreactor metagenome]|uniref:Uncharacterized protein n=1 Tax=bioreactor metagenome TaxID=1076179 RepID=A0A645AM84_9ZZZZ
MKFSKRLQKYKPVIEINRIALSTCVKIPGINRNNLFYYFLYDLDLLPAIYCYLIEILKYNMETLVGDLYDFIAIKVILCLS